MTKGPSFGTPRGVLTCILTLSLQTAFTGILPDYFSFNPLATSSCFYKLRLNSWNSALNFRLKKPKFCHLNVLICYCAANQYGEVACVFSKILKNRAALKVQWSSEIRISYSEAILIFLNYYIHIQLLHPFKLSFAGLIILCFIYLQPIYRS